MKQQEETKVVNMKNFTPREKQMVKRRVVVKEMELTTFYVVLFSLIFVWDTFKQQAKNVQELIVDIFLAIAVLSYIFYGLFECYDAIEDIREERKEKKE